MGLQLLKLCFISSLIAFSFVGCGEVEEVIEDIEDLNEAAIDVIDPTDTVQTENDIIFNPPSNPSCEVTQFPPDGLGGFLWKPSSESNSSLVVLLPGNFQKQFKSCIVYDGYVADRLSWNGFHNYDGQHNNQLRQHWRGSKPGSYYNAPALVVCDDCAWEVKTPWERVD